MYLRQSVSLASGELIDRYPPGMASLLLPFVLLADVGVIETSQQTGLPLGLPETRRLNVVLLPVGLLVTALMLDVIARLGATLSGRVGPRQYTLSLAVVTAVMAMYLLLPPEFVPVLNAERVPRRLTGLVFSYEPLVNAVVAALCLALLPRHRPAAARATIVVAGLTVLAISLREPVLAYAGAFGLILLVHRAGRPSAWQIAAGAAVFLGLLVGVSAAGRDSGEVLGRAGVYDGELLRGEAEQRYDWTLDAPPPQLSPRYLWTNLWEQQPLPVVVLSALLLGTLIAVVVRRNDWRPWAYLWAVTLVSVVLHAMWVNIVVTYRYNVVLVVPVAAALASLACGPAPGWTRRARASRSDGPDAVPSVAELAPGP